MANLTKEITKSGSDKRAEKIPTFIHIDILKVRSLMITKQIFWKYSITRINQSDFDNAYNRKIGQAQ